MGNPKFWGKDDNWKNWMEAGILTLSQLIDNEDEFLSYSASGDK